MKRFTVLALAAIAITGCAVMGQLASIINPAPFVSDSPVGIAHYDRVAPGMDVGSDGVGNFWLRETFPDTLCAILGDNGLEMIPIPCPAEGDSLR